MQLRLLAVACAWFLAACGSKHSAAPDAPVDTGGLVCAAMQTPCGDTCRALMTDANNCGACGHVCGLAISSTCLYFTASGDAQHPGSVRSHDLD
jgi:hypothetical protein